MGFVDYGKLTLVQQAQVKAKYNSGHWQPKDYFDFKFWVKPDGNISRRAGHHTLTKAGADRMRKELDRWVGAPVPPDKGGLGNFTGSPRFHLDRK